MAGTAATITMSMREADRVKTVQAVVDRMLPTGLAAQRLGLGRRRFIADAARNERRDSLAIWNALGQIVGSAFNVATFKSYAYVLTPVPEPGMIDLLRFGIATVRTRVRKRSVRREQDLVSHRDRIQVPAHRMDSLRQVCELGLRHGSAVMHEVRVAGVLPREAIERRLRGDVAMAHETAMRQGPYRAGVTKTATPSPPGASLHLVFPGTVDVGSSSVASRGRVD